MKRPHLCLILATLSLFAPPSLFGQNPAKCPTVWVDGPTSDITANSPIVFTTRSTGLNRLAHPEFRWEVSAGSIVSGQGGPSITIDTVGLGGVVVTATVSLIGLSKACPVEASRSVTILPPGFICGLAFDQYGDIRFEDEKARLDNFVIQLFNQGTATGYIFVYAGRLSFKGEAEDRLFRAKEYLVRVRNIDPARIVTIAGGYREEFDVTLIIAPKGAAPPSAMPTLSPEEIKLTKPRPSDLVKRKTSKRI